MAERQRLRLAPVAALLWCPRMCSASRLHNSGLSAAVALADLLTSTELARLLSVSVRKLERDRQEGTGVPYIKFGRRVLYRGADVEGYLEAQRFTSTAEARRAMEDR